MSSVNTIWLMCIGACLMLALLNLAVWKDRATRANLIFAVMATAVAVFAATELAMMRAATPAQFGLAVRWMQVASWTVIVSLVLFVRLYLQAGRAWLAWTVVGTRTLSSLVLNFVFRPNINYREIAELRHISFLGEPVSVAVGVPNPWMLIGQVSLLLLLVFVTDATVTAWRGGARRRALLVGGSILLFVTVGLIEGVLISWGIIRIPLTVSMSYLGILAAMAYELSYDVHHAATLARRLQDSETHARESEHRFQLVADAAPVMIWMSGVDKLCTFFNKTWLEFTGRRLGQETGNGWVEGVHPDDLQSCLKGYSEAFDARKAFVMRYRLRRRDGEYRWVSDQGVARYDTQGNFAGYIGSCVDVTDLMTKDEALRQSEERMRLAADAVNLGIWEWDLASDEIWASNARRAILGWPTSGKVTFEDFMSHVHPEDRNRLRQTIADAIREAKDYDSEYRLVLPDGVVRWMSGRGSVHFNADGKPTRVLGISIDVTAHKHAELDAQRDRIELSHLSRVALMGEMSASIAHELNQPLSGILSNAAAGQRFIDRGDVDLREIRELLGDIVADGRRASDVVRGIRNMVKKEQMTRRSLDLNEIVTDALRMVSADAILHSCQLETSLDQDLRAVDGDPIQLQQVLLNLVINAFDAMRGTPVSQRKVVIATESNGDGTVRATVRDYGAGVSDEMRERIFDPFFSTKTEGLGMGLAIVRSIVESHGGTITTENVDGGGARFEIVLPANGFSP
jgi:two-component system, LuxR family, sensor kinase FixL